MFRGIFVLMTPSVVRAKYRGHQWSSEHAATLGALLVRLDTFPDGFALWATQRLLRFPC